MKKKFIPVIALASILTLGTVSATITSCDPTQEVVEVTAITLSLSKNSGKVGETITATVTINPTEASDQKYELISSLGICNNSQAFEISGCCQPRLLFVLSDIDFSDKFMLCANFFFVPKTSTIFPFNLE